MWQWELPSWLRAQLLIWCIYTIYCLYSTCQVLAQLVTVHLEHKYIFQVCTYLNKVNIHTRADKQKMPTRVLQTWLVFNLHLEGHTLCCFTQRKSDRWTLNVVSFLGTESEGLGSPREPESCRAQNHSKWRTGVPAHSISAATTWEGDWTRTIATTWQQR